MYAIRSYYDHAAWRDIRSADVGHAINFRGLEPGPAHEKSRPFGRRLVHDDLHALAHVPFQNLGADAALQLHDAAAAFLALLGLHLVRQVRRGGAVLGLVGEDAQRVEADVGHEAFKGLHVLLGLAREADDEAGAQGRAGEVVAHAVDDAARVRGEGASHQLQDVRVGVLQGDVEIGGQRRADVRLV